MAIFLRCFCFQIVFELEIQVAAIQFKFIITAVELSPVAEQREGGGEWGGQLHWESWRNSGSWGAWPVSHGTPSWCRWADSRHLQQNTLSN